MHPSEAELQAALDGELTPAAERRVRAHVEECAECAGRMRSLELAEREIAAGLSLVDSPVPRLEAATLMARGRRHHASRGLLAAGLATLLLGAAAAAAVVPGFPLKGWLERATADWRRPASTTPEGDRGTSPAAPRSSGVSFAPETALEIAFLRSQSGGAIRIQLVDAHEVRVRHFGAAAAYDLNPAKLTVDNGGDAGSYEILLPRSLQHARVLVADRLVFEKQGAAISSRGSADARGFYVVPLQDRRME